VGKCRKNGGAWIYGFLDFCARAAMADHAVKYLIAITAYALGESMLFDHENEYI
jgi:hypothetical protein